MGFSGVNDAKQTVPETYVLCKAKSVYPLLGILAPSKHSHWSLHSQRLSRQPIIRAPSWSPFAAGQILGFSLADDFLSREARDFDLPLEYFPRHALTRN